jgi:hypothetical protein
MVRQAQHGTAGAAHVRVRCDACQALDAHPCHLGHGQADRVTQCGRAQHSTAQHSTAQHSTAQHSTAQHSTAQHSTAQHSTADHSTAQHSTAQHSTAQHSTAQHSTAQHSTAMLTLQRIVPLLRLCMAIAEDQRRQQPLLSQRIVITFL